MLVDNRSLLIHDSPPLHSHHPNFSEQEMKRLSQSLIHDPRALALARSFSLSACPAFEVRFVSGRVTMA